MRIFIQVCIIPVVIDALAGMDRGFRRSDKIYHVVVRSWREGGCRSANKIRDVQ